MDHSPSQQRVSRQGTILAWAIAGVLSLLILAVVLLAFLRPLQEDVQVAEQTREEGGGQVASEDDDGALLELVVDDSARCSVLIERALQISDQDCQRMGRNEIPGTKVGEMVMEKLLHTDQIAYIRFASVYRQFADISSLKKVVDDLVDSPSKGSQLPLLSGE